MGPRPDHRCTFPSRRMLPALLLIVWFAGLLSVPGNRADAHAPHDDVKGIVYSPDFEESGVAMAIVRGRLMRSVDRGVTWSEVVNGLGGEVQQLANLAVAPTDPSIVYATSTRNELLRSDDGGWSWRTLPATYGVAPASIVIAPVDAETVFTFGHASPVLARSTDGGESWARPQLDGAAIPVVDATTLPDGRIVVTDRDGWISSSEDAGETWVGVGNVGASSGIRRLAAAPVGRATLFASTGTGELFRSEDGGETFAKVGEGLPEEAISSVAISATFADDDSMWVVSRDSGPFRSFDRGASFERVFDGLTRSRQADDLDQAHFRTIAVAPDGSGEALVAGFDGIFRFDPDAGRWAAIETLSGYIAGLDVSPTYADDETLIVMSYVRGAFVSRNGGADWALANDGLTVEAIGEGNRFAPLRRLHNVHFSPQFAEDQTIWGANWVRVIRSRDGGMSWEEIPVGEPPEESPLRQFILAPSPEYAQDRTVFVGTRQGEVFRSMSEGDPDSWELLSTVPNRIRSIAVSPSLSSDGTLFVGTTTGVLRSVDGGVSWADTGVGNEAEAQGRETDFGIQVAVSPAFAADGLVLAATDSGLFRSDDAGITWEEVTAGALDGDHLIEALAFSPAFANDGLVLVSVRGLGLVRSTDGGASFAATGASLSDENLIIADFANPTSSPIQFSPTYATDGTIFAYAQQELLRSTNAGEDWSIVPLPSEEEVLSSLSPFEPAGDDSPLAQEPTRSDDGGAVPDGHDGITAAQQDRRPAVEGEDSGIELRLVLGGLGVLATLVLGVIVVRRGQ